ncbi:hypothetical protein NQ315_014454 [Exocentrus adspersus]|uniref:Uncharacterized protein n=1 Tax=Exocentrus adspersus TaxID=1586481 RepID=A0AAV8V731_9CUCU|nr:hypothetical protein NQ315_014454 [Exocentrus adspersus]
METIGGDIHRLTSHYMKEVLKQQHFIRGVVLDILGEVREIRQNKNTLDAANQDNRESVLNKFDLPLNTNEDLQNLKCSCQIMKILLMPLYRFPNWAAEIRLTSLVAL